MSPGAPIPVLAAAVVALVAGWTLARWVRVVCDSASRWLAGWTVGSLAGVLAVGAALASRTWWEFPAFWVLAVFCGLLVASDVAVLRLPNPIMIWAYPVFLVLLTVAAAGTGQWPRLGRALLGGLVLLVFYLVNALVFPSGMALGDVKFAGLLGAMLGWENWLHVLWGTLLAAILGGLVGLVLILARRGGLKTEYAYGPMMAVGAWTAMIWLK